tara:strand:- start:9778 stop:10413 length:636 start_codon:yes stop_codon:yes gene_type:complete
MKIDVRSKESVYITINEVTYYIDDSTNEQIVHVIKGVNLINYVPDTYAEGGEVDIMLTDDDLGYYSILHKGEFIEKDFQSKKEAENWARENNYTYAEGGEITKEDIALINKFMGTSVEQDCVWDILMSVVKKIESIEIGKYYKIQVDINEEDCVIYGLYNASGKEVIVESSEYEKQDSVKVAIILFIKWYEQMKISTYAEGGEIITKNNSV